ncbi:hypothetical protein Tco_0231252 [Tanacetum coccineum]
MDPFQFTMSNRHQELASPRQTTLLATPEKMDTGKEISNLLIADSLLKTISCDEVKTKNKRQNHNLWDIIVNGDLEDEATPSVEQSSPLVPKTAKQLASRRNQERIKSILLLAIPDEYLLKFHNVPDAKSLWAAIKSRFGGNEESKKMQKNVLKHQFENFVTASNETLDKAYDRFQKLISQLKIHGAYVSKEDIN